MSLTRLSLLGLAAALSTSQVVNAQFYDPYYRRRRNSRTRAIIGAVIGGVILLILILLIVLAKRRQRRMMRNHVVSGAPLPPRGRFGFGPMMFMRGGNTNQHHPHGVPPMQQHQQGFAGHPGGQSNNYQPPLHPPPHQGSNFGQGAVAGENRFGQFEPAPPMYHKDLEAGEKQLNNNTPAPPPAAHTNTGHRQGEGGFVGGFRSLN
ncbi:hypothetical protein BKA70DRAFT_1300605 [Coprinopsis sp. MPI-PUGE-AT-0042]|nr:hypothetical protein BKA70DRAFT_1300605 [Coprinopsis sp. MPI-PUGE-AT-0042]